MLAALSLVCAASFAQAQSDDMPKDLAWQSAKWTADDGDLRAIRKEVEAHSANNERLEHIIAKARGRCLGRSPSYADVFRWAISVNLRSSSDFDYWYVNSNSSDFLKPYRLFPSHPRPDSYEYTRAHFMLTVSMDFPHRTMVSLGRRLCAKDPTDVSVKLYLLRLLQPQAYSEDVPLGKRLVAELDQLSAGSLRTLVGTGAFFRRFWMKDHDPVNARQAINRLSRARALSKSKQQIKLMDQSLSEIKRGTKGLQK